MEMTPKSSPRIPSPHVTPHRQITGMKIWRRCCRSPRTSWWLASQMTGLHLCQRRAASTARTWRRLSRSSHSYRLHSLNRGRSVIFQAPRTTGRHTSPSTGGPGRAGRRAQSNHLRIQLGGWLWQMFGALTLPVWPLAVNPAHARPCLQPRTHPAPGGRLRQDLAGNRRGMVVHGLRGTLPYSPQYL